MLTTSFPLSREIRVPRKGSWPLASCSMVKEIWWSIEFNESWKEATASLLIMQKLWSTYRFQTFGGTGVVSIADCFISVIHGADGATHNTTVDLFLDGIIVNKLFFRRHKIQQRSYDIDVQLCSGMER